MNVPPDAYILVQEERLLAFVIACFEKSGIDADHAALISRLLVNNDLRGIRSHASRSAHGYCLGFEKGSYNPNPNVQVVQDTPAAVVLDGDGTVGYMPMIRAADHAVIKAREVGIGIALVRHIGHYGSAGHYARYCMEEGCIGISLQGYRHEADARRRDYTPIVAFSGDPPLSVAIPGGDEPAIVLDGGANLFGPYHGPGYEDLFARIPSTFFKSMGFIAVSALLGGALTGFTQPEGDAIEALWPGALMGGLVIAIDPSLAASGDVFRAEVDRYIRDLRDTHQPIPGTDRIRLPGHIEEERTAKHRHDGIRFGETEQQAMQTMHEHYGIALPWN